MVRTPARGLPAAAQRRARRISSRAIMPTGRSPSRKTGSCSRATPLSAVEALFAERDFNCLPVSEEGALGALLVGIIAQEDVLRALRHAAAGERPAAQRSRCNVSRWGGRARLACRRGAW